MMTEFIMAIMGEKSEMDFPGGSAEFSITLKCHGPLYVSIYWANFKQLGAGKG